MSEEIKVYVPAFKYVNPDGGYYWGICTCAFEDMYQLKNHIDLVAMEHLRDRPLAAGVYNPSLGTVEQVQQI